MKKLSAIIIAMALVFGMTQCKKKIVTTTASQGGVFLTVNVNSNYKADVDPSGTVDFTPGDFLFVMNGMSPVGVLIYGLDGHNNEFSGIIGEGNALNLPTDLDNNANLKFVYTGSEMPNEDYTVDIWDQRSNLPVLSCGDTGETTLGDIINDGGVIPQLELKNQCALVKFKLSNASTEDVRIFGVYTKARFIISGNGVVIEPTGDMGYIILNNKGTNDERWGIMLPGPNAIAMPNANATVGYAKYTQSASIPQIITNGLQNGTINNSGDGVPAKDVFSISDGEWVKLAPGNVQYKASSNTWRFAEHQWDYVGGTDVNTNTTYGGISGSTNNSIGQTGYEGWIDLFGWGTGNEPTKYIIDTYDDPAPGTGQTSCAYSVFNDWGKNLDDGCWFTMSRDKWSYLIDYGKVTTDRTAKMAPATVNGIEGIVLLSDIFEVPSGCTYTAPVYNPTDEPYDHYYHHMEEYNMNIYDENQWSAMESAGAIFLPAAGYRMGQVYIRECPATANDPASLYTRYYAPASKGAKTTNGLYGTARLWLDDCFRCEGLAVRLAHTYEF